MFEILSRWIGTRCGTPVATVTAAGLAVVMAAGFAATAFAQEILPQHPPLGTEGLYDPTNPALQYLQQPEEALGPLPKDLVGNMVNWVEAIGRGHIAPRAGVTPDARMNIVDMNVVMSRTASMPYVKFPHKQHTEWLSCTNCHPQIFLPKKDGNPVTMHAILKGEFCGVCHGKVAFPLTDCFRCHNTRQDSRSLSR